MKNSPDMILGAMILVALCVPLAGVYGLFYLAAQARKIIHGTWRI
jgi:hypothetical protein